MITKEKIVKWFIISFPSIVLTYFFIFGDLAETLPNVTPLMAFTGSLILSATLYFLIRQPEEE